MTQKKRSRPSSPGTKMSLELTTGSLLYYKVNTKLISGISRILVLWLVRGVANDIIYTWYIVANILPFLEYLTAVYLYLNPWRVRTAFQACVASSINASFLEEEMYCNGQTRPAQPKAAKPVINSKHRLRPGPADPQFLVGRGRLGGIAYVYCLYLI